jgi:hypothetical protein
MNFSPAVRVHPIDSDTAPCYTSPPRSLIRGGGDDACEAVAEQILKTISRAPGCLFDEICVHVLNTRKSFLR